LEQLGTADAKLSHSVKQRCPLHSQSFRGSIPATHRPIARFKGPDDVIPLNFLEKSRWNMGLSVRLEGFQLGGGGAQCGVRRKNDGSLDEVL
jgi:hypothetical protein